MEEVSGEVKASRGISMKVLAIIILVIILLSFFSFYGIRSYQCKQFNIKYDKSQIYFYKCLSLCPQERSLNDVIENNKLDSSCFSFCTQFTASNQDFYESFNDYCDSDFLATSPGYCSPLVFNGSVQFQTCLRDFFEKNKEVLDVSSLSELSNFSLEDFKERIYG